MDVGVHSDAFLLPLGNIHVDHGYFDADSGVLQKVFLGSGNAPLEDNIADLDDVLGLALVEVALIDQLNELFLGNTGHGLGSESVLFEAVDAHGGGLVLGLDG